jgi:hypothetical protein
VVRRQELTPVQKVPEMDETIVGDGLDPLEGQAAAGIVEDNATCIEAALLLVSKRSLVFRWSLPEPWVSDAADSRRTAR